MSLIDGYRIGSDVSLVSGRSVSVLSRLDTARSDLVTTPLKRSARFKLHSRGSSRIQTSTWRFYLQDVWHNIYLFLRGQLVLDPEGSFKQNWDLIVVLGVTYNVITVPWFIAFDQDQALENLPIDMVILVLMLIDMLFVFRSGFTTLGEQLVFDSSLVARRYMTSSKFTLDLLSVMPIEFIAWALPRDINGDDRFTVEFWYAILKVKQLLRLHKLFANPRLDGYFHTPGSRVLKVFLLWCLMAHYIACVLVFVGLNQQDGETWNWMISSGMEPVDESKAETYIAALYWATVTLSAIGYGDKRLVTTTEQSLALGILMAAVCFYAAFFSNIGAALSSFQNQARTYQKSMDSAKEFAAVNGLPIGLAKKMAAYEGKRWTQTHGFNTNVILDHLPLPVQCEVLTYIHHTLATSLPFSISLLNALFLRLGGPSILCKGDYVFREGDLTLSIYFVKQGTFLVHQEHPVTHHDVTLTRMTSKVGENIFGEIALLLNLPRTASIQAETDGVYNELRREDFLDLVSMFPEELNQFMPHMAIRRLKEDLQRLHTSHSQQHMSNDDDASHQHTHTHTHTHHHARNASREIALLGEVIEDRIRKLESGEWQRMDDHDAPHEFISEESTFSSDAYPHAHGGSRVHAPLRNWHSSTADESTSPMLMPIRVRSDEPPPHDLRPSPEAGVAVAGFRRSPSLHASTPYAYPLDSLVRGDSLNRAPLTVGSAPSTPLLIPGCVNRGISGDENTLPTFDGLPSMNNATPPMQNRSLPLTSIAAGSGDLLSNRSSVRTPLLSADDRRRSIPLQALLLGGGRSELELEPNPTSIPLISITPHGSTLSLTPNFDLPSPTTLRRGASGRGTANTDRRRTLNQLSDDGLVMNAGAGTGTGSSVFLDSPASHDRDLRRSLGRTDLLARLAANSTRELVADSVARAAEETVDVGRVDLSTPGTANSNSNKLNTPPLSPLMPFQSRPTRLARSTSSLVLPPPHKLGLPSSTGGGVGTPTLGPATPALQDINMPLQLTTPNTNDTMGNTQRTNRSEARTSLGADKVEQLEALALLRSKRDSAVRRGTLDAALDSARDSNNIFDAIRGALHAQPASAQDDVTLPMAHVMIELTPSGPTSAGSSAAVSPTLSPATSKPPSANKKKNSAHSNATTHNKHNKQTTQTPHPSTAKRSTPTTATKRQSQR